LDGVDFVPAGNDIGGSSDIDAIGFESGFGRFEDEIVQIRDAIVAGPNGVRYALFIEAFDFDDSAGATRLTNANFFRVRPSADALG